MSNSKTFRLNRRDFTKPHREVRGDITVEIGGSPYDFPESVTGGYEDELKKFVIRFNYIGGREPLEMKDENAAITLWIGKTSSRLHEVHLDMDKLVEMGIRERVADRVTGAIRHLEERGTARRPNYEATRQAIERHSELFAVSG